MITRNFENATFSPLQGTKSLSEARSASALGNITKLSAKSPRGTNNRYKYALLDTAQRYMPNARVATCQRVPVGYFPHGDVSNAEIGIGKAENGRMKFGGVRVVLPLFRILAAVRFTTQWLRMLNVAVKACF
jgi:hypothetical protein